MGSTTSEGNVESSGYRTVVFRRPVGFVPRHPLDVPAGLSSYAEGELRPREFLSKAEAVAEVREYNLRQLTQGGNSWAICLKVGEPLDEASTSSVTLVDGAGIEEHGIRRPVRVVIPRAELVAA